MIQNKPMQPIRLARRAALLAPLALTGCSWFDSWFGSEKKPIPGKREPVVSASRGLRVDAGAPPVSLPPPVRNAAWPQAGGNPAHLMGHLAANAALGDAWRAEIGQGGGYRKVILAQPVVANGVVYTMDSNATVSAFSLSNGGELWRVHTKDEDAESTNVGGGLAVANGTLYAVNGLGDLVALDAAKGAQKWRTNLGAPARSAPTVVEGRLFIVTIQDKLLARAADDGHDLWSYQSTSTVTSVLGRPAPAYANGLVIAGFGDGALVCLRADSGNVVWSDGLGSEASGVGLADFTSIRGRPVISNGRVFAIGMGGLTLALDLPTGRRLWERQVGGEASPWVAGDWMFVISSSQDLGAIHTPDGTVAWVSNLPRWENPEKLKDSISWFGPALVGDRLVVTSTSKDALSISPYSGQILGRQSLSAPAAPLEPVVADGTLLVVSNDARLLALR